MKAPTAFSILGEDRVQPANLDLEQEILGVSPTCMRACAREAMADQDAYSGGASCQCRQVSPLSPERFFG
jgi:hypothetical protein